MSRKFVVVAVRNALKQVIVEQIYCTVYGKFWISIDWQLLNNSYIVHQIKNKHIQITQTSNTKINNKAFNYNWK